MPFQILDIALIGIMLINFIIIQVAPGGPVEQAIAQLTGEGVDITERVTRGGTGDTGAPVLVTELDPDVATDPSRARARLHAEAAE